MHPAEMWAAPSSTSSAFGVSVVSFVIATLMAARCRARCDFDDDGHPLGLLAGCACVFFGKMSSQILCPFENSVVCLLIKFKCTFRFLVLYPYQNNNLQIYSPILSVLFTVLRDDVLQSTKTFYFYKVSSFVCPSLSFLVACAFCVASKKLLLP